MTSDYVYTGNVHDGDGGSTWCPNCGLRLIERDFGMSWVNGISPPTAIAGRAGPFSIFPCRPLFEQPAQGN